MVPNFDMRPLLWVLLVVALLMVVGAGYGCYQWGHGSATATAQVRYDSLNTRYNSCRSTVEKVKTQGAVAEAFMKSYDQELSDMSHEKRDLQFRYDSAVAAASRLAPRPAEAAVANRYK